MHEEKSLYLSQEAQAVLTVFCEHLYWENGIESFPPMTVRSLHHYDEHLGNGDENLGRDLIESAIEELEVAGMIFWSGQVPDTKIYSLTPEGEEYCAEECGVWWAQTVDLCPLYCP